MELHNLGIQNLLNCRKSKTKEGFTFIWYDQPYNLYYDKEQAFSYISMIDADKFSKSLHDPIIELVTDNTREIINNTKNTIEFYDLGPGLPTKTIPLLKEIIRQKKKLVYIPVDISKSFLEITEQEVKKIGIKSHGINCLFEDLPERIPPKNGNITRIFQIGLTFNNYRPNQIYSLLKTLSAKNDFSLIITEYYTTKKRQSLLLPYQDIYAERFNFLALELLGFRKSDFVYHTQYRSQRIEMGFIPKHHIKINGFEITPKHKIVTAISYRYTKNSLTINIQKHFEKYEHYAKGDLVIYKLKD